LFRIFLNASHLRAAIREYLAHYQEPNHQGLLDQLIVPPATLNRPGPLECRERLGGLLRFYYQKRLKFPSITGFAYAGRAIHQRRAAPARDSCGVRHEGSAAGPPQKTR
jgi:hypothetical protein